MTTLSRYPFVWLGVPFGLILLFTFGPTAALMFGAAAAQTLGCNVPISATEPCLFLGVDLSGAVIVAILMGYLAFFTLPIGVTLRQIWFAVAMIVTLVWWLRRRRAT
jgi:hypothetical protein